MALLELQFCTIQYSVLTKTAEMKVDNTKNVHNLLHLWSYMSCNVNSSVQDMLLVWSFIVPHVTLNSLTKFVYFSRKSLLPRGSLFTFPEIFSKQINDVPNINNTLKVNTMKGIHTYHPPPSHPPTPKKNRKTCLSIIISPCFTEDQRWSLLWHFSKFWGSLTCPAMIYQKRIPNA